MSYVGLRIGKILVLEKTEKRDSKGYILWKFKCDCGIERLTRSTNLNLKNKKVITSCGCQAYETNSLKETTHGDSRGPNKSLYIIWQGIKNRCLNKKAFAYKDYGGRGIKICDEWKDSFEKFKEDMFDGYSKGLSIERNDVNGNYEKSNCRWITKSEQASNRRTTIYMDTLEGIMKIQDAADLVGICWQAMYTRYKHWPRERWLERK